MEYGKKKGITDLTPAERAMQATYRVELGEYLKNLRAVKGMSTRAVGEELNVSSNYISEIERGIKAPADHTLREIAQLYNVDENILFDKLKRVPLKATEALNSHERLQKLLTNIQDADLNTKELDQLYDIMEATFNKYLNNKEKGKQQSFFGKFYPKTK